MVDIVVNIAIEEEADTNLVIEMLREEGFRLVVDASSLGIVVGAVSPDDYDDLFLVPGVLAVSKVVPIKAQDIDDG